MADEIPENVDLRFLATQSARILGELSGMRDELGSMHEQTQHIPQIRADLSELQREVAAMRVDQNRTNELLETVAEVQKNQGARLNAIDGRLAIIEKHTGLVRA